MNYTTNNVYFNSIINEYFNEDAKGWMNMNGEEISGIKYCDSDFVNYKLNSCKITNQITDTSYLGNKKMQYQNFYKKKNGKMPIFIPKTFIFKKNNCQNISSYFNNKTKWIVKPENSLARKGVKVISSYPNLLSWINNFKYNEWILQEYIDDPLLINGKKFHFRVYGIIVKTNKNLKTYIYNKGFMYFAKNIYNKNIIDQESHLSGESSQEQVGVYPEMFNQYFGNRIFKTKILPKIEQIVKETVDVVSDKIMCPNIVEDYKCYKMIGYDILVDKNYNLYLAEINTRLISLKYPPPYFKKEFYYSILSLALKNNTKNFKLVLNKNIDNVIEGFTNKKMNISKNNYILKICLLTIIIIYANRYNDKISTIILLIVLILIIYQNKFLQNISNRL